MSFVFPGFLFALFAISIPIIIHLFHFRRFRKVFFSNVTFLQQLSDESKKQSRIRHWVVLALRILAIACIVLAFARPYIPVADSRVSMEGNTVAVYLDNSFSMDALSDRGRLMDDAREKAKQIAEVYQPADRFMLLTNDFEGRHQRFVSRDEFLVLADEVQVSSAVKTTGEVLQRIAGLFETEPVSGKKAYLISDFQKSIVAFDDFQADTSFITTLIPLSAQGNDNVFIDSCWFEVPVKIAGQTAQMSVRIRNDSGQTLTEQPVRLYIDGQQRTVGTYDLQPAGTAEAELSWTISTPGIHHGRIEILDYPVTFDDGFFFSYTVSPQIPVLAIDEGRPSPFLRALFGNDTIFSFQNTPVFSVDYSVLGSYHLIVLDGLSQLAPGLALELQQYVAQGGSLVVLPGTRADLDSYRSFLASMETPHFTRLDTIPGRVSGLNEMHPVYAGVFDKLPENMDLPVVNKYYQLSQQVRSTAQHLMQLQNGLPFFLSQVYGKGQVFLSAVPLLDEFSNFQRHALFVPTLVNIALQSQASQQLHYTLGSDNAIAAKTVVSSADEVFTVRGDQTEVIPEQRSFGNQTQLFLHEQINLAGNYSLFLGDREIQGIALNYDRRESLLATHAAGELRSLLRDEGLGHIRVMDTAGVDFDSSFREFRLGRQLWRLFVIMALIFLLAEGVVLRFWKHA